MKSLGSTSSRRISSRLATSYASRVGSSARVSRLIDAGHALDPLLDRRQQILERRRAAERLQRMRGRTAHEHEARDRDRRCRR